jgi:hypothetical protein
MVKQVFSRNIFFKFNEYLPIGNLPTFGQRLMSVKPDWADNDWQILTQM